MNFIISCRSSHLRHRHCDHQIRTLYDGVSSLQCPRDRGLDHAVERDKHLRPLLNLKNLIISEPSKSVPLSLITEAKEALGIPFRPIDFIRKYPLIFQEFHPGSLKIHPHVKLTPEIISISSEENLLYQSVDYKQDIAGRLLKLLMISRINKIPIFLLERLKWELGLPQDYENAIIPEFPDYFRVLSGKDSGENGKVLELVCWSGEFAVSEMEKRGLKDGKSEFLLQFSKEFEMDKKYKKWLNDWQKLPYVSPYENAMHLASKTDESDKWSVAVLHEVLNLFVGKRAERDNLLFLGEHLGLRSRFKLAFLQHPGIFYVSSKIGTHTVVLKEAYKRGMLIKRHPLVDMRSKYIKLMNAVKDEEKSKHVKQKTGLNVKKIEGKEIEGVEVEGEGEGEDNDEICDSSDDDENVDQEEALKGENRTRRGRFNREGVESKNRTRRVRSNREGVESREGNGGSMTRRIGRRRGGDGARPRPGNYGNDDHIEPFKRGTFKRKAGGFEDRNSGRSVGRKNGGRENEGNVLKNSWFSRKTDGQDGDPILPRRTRKNSDFSGNRARSKTGQNLI